MSAGYTPADIQRMRAAWEMHPYPLLQEGDPVGWVDRDGTVHVERFKSMGPHGIELESQPDPMERYAAFLADEVTQILIATSRRGAVRQLIGETGESTT